MPLAGGLFQDAALFVNVAKVVSDLDQPDLFVSGVVGADNLGVSALAVVALAVPAVKGEADAFLRLCKVGFTSKPLFSPSAQ